MAVKPIQVTGNLRKAYVDPTPMVNGSDVSNIALITSSKNPTLQGNSIVFPYIDSAGVAQNHSVDLSSVVGSGSGGGGGLSTVISDSTLTGDGSADTPLGVAIPFSQSEKNKLAALDATNLPVGASSPIKYNPSVIYHDPNKIQGNHLVSLSEVIAQVEANNTLYTHKTNWIICKCCKL